MWAMIEKLRMRERATDAGYRWGGAQVPAAPCR
jgi:hypothetical protein